MPALIKGVEFGGLIADKAFDANWIVAELNERGAKVAISQRPKRKAPLAIELDVYKWRHLIENYFLQAARVQASSHAQRQDRYKLRSYDPPGSCNHQLALILNRP